MKPIHSLLILAISYQFSFAQIYPNFIHSYDVKTNSEYNERSDMTLTYDNGYVISCRSFDSTIMKNTIELIKISYDGYFMWRTAFESDFSLHAAFVEELPDSGLIIAAGIANGSGYQDLLIKTDKNGIKLWAKTYGEPDMNNLVRGFELKNDYLYVLSSGNYMYSGTITPAYFILKTDLDGNPEYMNSYNWSGSPFPKAFCVSDADELFVGGEMLTDGTAKLGLSKINSMGNIVWSRIYSPGGNYDPLSMIIDGDYLMISGRCSFAPEYWDVMMMKFDTDGNFIWGKTYGLDDYDEGYDIFKSGNGYTLLAEPESFNNISKSALIHIDTLGTVEWMKLYGDTSAMFPNAAIQLDDGFAIYGIMGDYFSYARIYLLKTNEDGETSCQWKNKTMEDSAFNLLWEIAGSQGVITGFNEFEIDDQLKTSATYDECEQEPSFIYFPETMPDISIFPNPFRDNLTIQLKNQQDFINIIQITNCQGELVYYKDNLNQVMHQVYTTSFSPGLYSVSIITNQSRFTYNIIRM